MIVLLALVALCASAAGQLCQNLVSMEVVRMQRNQFTPNADASDPVVFSCTATNGSVYVAATAYIAGYLLDYRCMDPDGWEPIAGVDQVTEVYDRDIADRSCSACVANTPGSPTPPIGHCQRCGTGCATCGVDACFTCSTSYSLSGTSCVNSGSTGSGGSGGSGASGGLSTEILVVIIVCSVLGVVFLVLTGAAVVLVVYIFTFTRTETIAHRRLKTDKGQQVSYRHRQNIGTHRHNPMFGVAEGWGAGANPAFTDTPEGGWTNPLAATRRPPLPMQTADGNNEEEEEQGDIGDEQVEKVAIPEGTVEYDEYDDY